MALKTRPRIGDRRWYCDWCASIPVDENGDADMDNAKEMHRPFATLEEAMVAAKEIAPTSVWGVVTVGEEVFCPYDENDAAPYPHVGYWEGCGETFEVETE